MERQQSAGDNYQEILDNVYNYNGVGFALLLAKEVGILDALMTSDKPMTLHELAESKMLKERYARELLASLVCARLIKASVTESGTHLYHLERTAKKTLLENNNVPNVLVPHILMASYENVKKSLLLNGPLGFPYSKEFEHYIDEWSIYSEDSIIEFLLTKVPDIKNRLDAGIRVLEFGSGSGTLIGKLARRFPKSKFTASEMNIDFVNNLKRSLGHLPNMQFEVYDLSHLQDNPKKPFDWLILKNSTHVVPHPGQSLKDTRRFVAERNGIFTCLDFVGEGDPLKSLGDIGEALKYIISLFHCVPISLHQAKDSPALGCCWSKETAIRLFQEARYEVTTHRSNLRQVLFVAKPV